MVTAVLILVSATAFATVPVPAPSAAPGLALWVVESVGRPADELDRVLTGVGGSVVATLGPGRWLVVGPAAGLGSAMAPAQARAWHSSEAVIPELRNLAERGGDATGPVVGIVVAVAPGSDLRTVGADLVAAGARLEWTRPDAHPLPQLGVRVPTAELAAVIGALDETRDLAWADLQPPIRLRNAASVWRCQSGNAGSTPLFDRGLHGEGQIIGIMDTGLDIDDCRFDDAVNGLPAISGPDGTEVDLGHRKVLAVDFHWLADWPPADDSWDDSGHGTHVAGSAAGDSLGNGTFDGVDGMAPAARLVIQDGGFGLDDCADLPGLGCPVKPLGPVFEQAWSQGARIHTDSWGDEENILPFGRYTERTADVDRFMWEHKDTLVLFAAGNAGPGLNTVESPATAKNVVAMGATLHGDQEPTCVAPFSSRGWTRDGRIKPDLVAPGSQVVSAASDGIVPSPSCDDSVKSGTSMASPTAAGLAALVRQYFADGFYPTGWGRERDGFEPTAALVKAVLIASAVDLATLGCVLEPIPSRDQGWGLIQLDTALAFAGDDRRLLVDDHLNGFVSSDDGPVRLEIDLTEAGPLKIVLVWTDPPSSSLATTNLVNDLDLTVNGAAGAYLGNVMTGGVSQPGGVADRLNNVEVVWLPDADEGLWRVEISPHVISVPAQDFALAVTGEVRRMEGPRRPSGRRSP